MKRGILFLSVFLTILVLTSFIAAVGINSTEEDLPDPEIPGEWQKIFKLIFKLDQVEFKEVVIMSGLLILAILIIQQALSMGLENKIAGWSIAIVISLIASSSGALQYVANTWTNLGGIAKIPEKMGVFWTSFGIIILVLAFILIKYLKKTTKATIKVTDSEKLGFLEGMREARDKIKAKFS